MSPSSLPKSFDTVASEYDRMRPGYPEATFERIVSYAGIQDSPAPVLEIGTGTGKATRPLAVRGHNVLCIEPGANLARCAATNLAEFPNVTLEVSSFEEWKPMTNHFHLAFCAQAFHWLDPAIRLEKLASVLKPGGALAVFGNSNRLGPSDLSSAIQAAYERHAPTLSQRDNATAWYCTPDSPVARELRSSTRFRDVDFLATEWTRELSADAYCGLLATFSDHSTLPAQQRRPLLAAIADAISQHGGIARLQYTTALFLARSC